MSAGFDSEVGQPRIGNAWSQGGMWSAAVVVGHPRCQDFDARTLPKCPSLSGMIQDMMLDLMELEAKLLGLDAATQKRIERSPERSQLQPTVWSLLAGGGD
jgi:hypothetical protein